MGAFPFGFATNFSWLSAMLDASSSGGVVLVIMSPVKTRFSGFFFRTNQFFEPWTTQTGKNLKTVKPHPSTANYRLQLALQEIKAWTKAWLVRINRKKRKHTLCSLSNQQPKFHINCQPLKADYSPIDLGVTLDRQLTRRNEISKIKEEQKSEWFCWRSSDQCVLAWPPAAQLQNPTQKRLTGSKIRPCVWWQEPCVAHQSLRWKAPLACSLLKTEAIPKC